MEKTTQTKEEAQAQLGSILNYDKYIVCFSGGKDSIALLLYLFEEGVDRSKIELWHHDIDGEVKANEKHFMDWAITKDYTQKFADAFGIKIYYSWREGGFKREMLRDNQTTGNIWFEDENKNPVVVKSRTGERYENTRLKFPQKSADLSVRWCSSYLKIDVCSSAIRNQDRFKGIRTLVLTGERGEESSARSKYYIFEPHRSDLRNGKIPRHVDHYRPLRDWSENEVWDIIKKHGVKTHPAYDLGFSRVSCMKCIFGNKDQWASVFAIDPEGTKDIIEYEAEFGITIDRNKSVPELIEDGKPYEAITSETIAIATAKEYNIDIITDSSDWRLPEGAYGTSCGSV